MAVFTIRAHKRFAVCRHVRLRQPKRRGIEALLIELSLDGCRLSHTGMSASPAPGDPIVLRIPGADPIDARVRWCREDTLGLRFERPLHVAALGTLIEICREQEQARAYGT